MGPGPHPASYWMSEIKLIIIIIIIIITHSMQQSPS
jgi:hypothetical protein